MAATTHSSPVNTSPFYSIQLRRFAVVSFVMMLASLFVLFYLSPFANMIIISLESRDQMSTTKDGAILPSEPVTFDYQGQKLNMYTVPLDSGDKVLAMLQPGRKSSQFIDPAHPDAPPIVWEGQWRTLPQATSFKIHPENFATVWNDPNLQFLQLFRNTLVIAVTGLIGTLISCISVAYAFARFPIPGKNVLFLVLIATIIIPAQVTLIPTYTFFSKIGWVGTWLPLIVPHFFANAYNVFLLRQYFMTLPRQLDEAAMIDGATPFQVLLKVIIPQSWPVIISVSLFHIIFAWNDYFGPLIYLLGHTDLQPISVGVQVYNYAYGAHPELVQATSLLAMALPLILFFAAQRFFMRGVVITGVDK